MSLRFTSTCGRREKVERAVSGEGTSSGLVARWVSLVSHGWTAPPSTSQIVLALLVLPLKLKIQPHAQLGLCQTPGLCTTRGKAKPKTDVLHIHILALTGTKSPTTFSTAGGEGEQGRTPNKLKKETEMRLATKGMSSESRSLQACSLLFLRDKPRASFQLKKKKERAF